MNSTTWRNGWREDEPRIHLPTYDDQRGAGGGYARSQGSGSRQTLLETAALNQRGRGAAFHHQTDTTAEKPIHQVTYYRETMKVKKKSTVITIDSELHSELRAVSEKHGIKIGFLAEKAVRELLAKMSNTTQVSASLTAVTH